MRKPKNRILGGLLSILRNEIQSHRTLDGRRNFLKQTAKATVAFTVASSIPAVFTSCKTATGNGASVNSNKILDIAILGGGMAGLNCANHLLDSGLSFRIFEADRRIGGRILTHYNDSLGLGIFPEFGAEFIDSDHEDMLALCKEFNLELLDMIAEQEKNNWIKDIYFFDNRRISEAEIIKEFKKVAPKIAKDLDALGENYDTEEAVKFDNMPLSDYLKSLKCAKWLKELFDVSFVAEFGLDCKDQSTINFLDMVDTDTSEGFKVFGTSDERYRVKGGNSEVIKHLAAKVGMDNIDINYEVNAIEELEDSTYLISFKNGEQVNSKSVVCTIPYTILRKIDLKLKGMSPEKRKCIDELGYGINTKLLLGYDSLPWRSKENNAMGYLFTTEMTNGWDASVNKKEDNPNGAYIAFFGGDLSQELANKSFKNPYQPPTHVWRTGLPDETVDYYLNSLDKIFKHSKEHYIGRYVFVNWIDYPFVKASYSCYRIGQWTSIAGLEMQPVGNFLFAGEHCSAQFQGFMNGAAETGRRVAEEILKTKEVVANN